MSLTSQKKKRKSVFSERAVELTRHGGSDTRKRHTTHTKRKQAYRTVVAKGALVLVDLGIVRGHGETDTGGMGALHGGRG